MAGVLSPQISTRLTSGIVCRRSTKRSSAKRDSSSSERWSLRTVTWTIGGSSSLDFDTVGGSTSAGRFRIARDTRSRTSLVAVSRSIPSSNSTDTVLRPSRLTEVKLRMPAMPLIEASRGSVIWLSMTSEAAPR